MNDGLWIPFSLKRSDADPNGYDDSDLIYDAIVDAVEAP